MIRPLYALTASALAAALVCGCDSESPRARMLSSEATVGSPGAASRPPLPSMSVACGTRLPSGVTNQALVDAQRSSRSSLPGWFRAQIVIPSETLWPRDQPVRVRFLDGTPARRQRVQAIASEWMSPDLWLAFRFVDSGDAEIRVSLPARRGPAQSAVGVLATNIPDPRPTLEIGLDDTMTDDEVRGLVLHEFGHALGALHEHQRRDAGINWDKPYVYEFYRTQHGWDRPTVDMQVFEPHAAGLTASAAFDPASVMMYPIPPGFTTDKFVQGWNTRLSPADVQLVKELYGK